MSGALLVFAKAPRAGLVKTRMCPPLSSEEAAALYGAMLDDVLEATAAFARRLRLEPVVCVHPPDALGEFARRAPAAYRIVAQRGADLSERMSWAIAEAAAGGAAPVLVRGSDSPTLGLEALEAALDALSDADLALCPDLDGGYDLVALRRPAPGLFGHPMSTGEVLRDTLACADRLGLRSRVLEPGFDLDTAEDLARLAAWRDQTDTERCRRTLAWLDGSDLWARLRAADPTARRPAP